MLKIDSVLLAAIASLGVTVAAMLALRPIAHIVDLIDRPGGRKMHSGAVPVVGGLAMLLGIVFGVSSMPGTAANLQAFLFSATLLVVVGLLDDRFNLSPTMRLIAQFAAVLPMVFGAGVYLRTLGDPFGLGELQMGAAYVWVTAFFTLASVNAFNMLDGLDGLAGGLALTAFAFMFALVAGFGREVDMLMIATMCGSIVGFLLFNAPLQVNRRLRCFMGDAGSTLLGFSVAWMALSVSQVQPTTATPVTMLWLVLVPATDLVWTVVRRVARGQSPLRADSEHLHHSLLKLGLGVRAVFAIMVLAAVLAGVVGIAFQRAGLPEWMSLLGVILAGVMLVVVFRRGRFLVALVPESLRRDHEQRYAIQSGTDSQS